MDAASLVYTLCFLQRGEQILMLHRRRPPNQGLWNGIGGRIEPGETPRQSMLREIREESGYALQEVHFAGVLTWEGFEIPPGGLYIFTAQAPAGDPVANDEGELAWKDRAWVFSSPEVVSNIHRFGPCVVRGDALLEHHFVYRDGEILAYRCYDLPEEFLRGLLV